MYRKIERNAPCWCGSGKKYKACHQAFDEKIIRFERMGHTVPGRNLLKTPQDIEGIKKSAVINIAVLDEVGDRIRAVVPESGEKNALTYCRNSSAGTSTTCEGATSAGNTISLEFGSAKTEGETYSGLNLTVEVLSEHSIGIAAVDGGAVIANKLSSLVGDTILLTPQLENGHYFEGVSVVDKNGEPVTVKYAYSADGLSYTSARFAMPDEDVTVTPVFMDHLPVRGALVLYPAEHGTTVAHAIQ